MSGIIKYLKPLKPERDLYYAIRDRRSKGYIKRVAEFIYLNKTCWNGLYRVNANGHFNVPYGGYATRSVADFENLRACSEALQKPSINLSSYDFEEALLSVKAGDLVYLDPPYVTRHNNNGFVSYNEKIFSWEDQKRLAATARRLMEAGAFVIVSNAKRPEIFRLYRGFKKETVNRISTLAADAKYRGPVTEAIIYSPNCLVT